MKVLKIQCPASIPHLLVFKGAADSQINILNKKSSMQHRGTCIRPILADKGELISKLKSGGCLGESDHNVARIKPSPEAEGACSVKRASSTKLKTIMS